MAPTLGKWGNSVGIRLPKHVVETSGLTLSDPVTIHAEAGRIVIERRRRRLSLRDILKAWPKDEKHEELDWGPTRGNEV
ncbi:MAG: AbrB/MazE/SpoVT family DNA-binding domain-containing protein [Acidobacteria bacterium]|nr:AbrB/MazE/SpoVT family DNA-binding domain-containing protein [Acidobacteriota bacterium]